mmetsp:Transcript_23430/g.34391  ORF Transcript_23430/g.34391 Transcript_23430/m.34391 type:complete len:824 (-) Transcript_23430:274-2745(-)|eukprot:CAMPEP_0185025040 /NCGR_PEP_ID=MMETSP1103-20130426/8150_1 /TAXON_ID=36769 /ORGANISM="Paraphysomonas bandaiensis, Strain Caron Lab Isolate" /LENGTH=823 /DNA_ID=CAMNT_0027558151 /DNA_START=52 /DNA_END=2523 /DNA_ORIENTATION=-
MRSILSKWVCLCLLLCLCLCEGGHVDGYDVVYCVFGENLGAVPNRVRSLLRETGIRVEEWDAEANQLNSSSLVLSLGNTSLSSRYLSLDDVRSEGFEISTREYISNSTLIVANGKPMEIGTRQFALDVDSVHYGAAVGSYAALELLGFRFLHPLAPYIPSFLPTLSRDIYITESPYWEKRTWHIHTQHPLEFTEVLNGYDIPMFSNDSSKTCPRGVHCETWEDMFLTLDGLFEWLLANRQNRVEVLLLGNEKWDAWGELTSGTKRQLRLREINRLAHKYGVLIGADIPLANLQQHGWAMVNIRDDFDTQKSDIENRVDWAFTAEYDFISTESGLSEFTKPSCDTMLQLFEVYTSRVTTHWKREALTKVHCSTDQYCEDVNENGELKYPDPRTGEPINFNFLPTYASEGLAVMPHTVQVYSLDDPTAGAYGNENFSYMSDYMTFEASLKKRDVLFYPETAYWVNVDVDVPLFIPLFGQRRLYDLRRTARQQEEQGFRINGQMNFESGWEYGYHLSNVITARAAWNPLMDEADDWEAFLISLRHVLGLFGDFAEDVSHAIVRLSQTQAEVMVHGKVHHQESSDLTKLSGHAYMSGADTWVDIPRLLGLSFTQPDKVHLTEPSDPQWEDALKILSEMQHRFGAHAQDFMDIRNRAEGVLDRGAMAYLDEFVDCVKLLALRAEHNQVLYMSQDLHTTPEERNRLLLRGRELLTKAGRIMADRAELFRVPVMRIAGWRQNPTVYPYGYVWSANSLYYWWRDQGIAENSTYMASSPCYMNRMEPLELAFGWGKAVEEVIRIALEKAGVPDTFTTCLAPPLHEYKFPRDL